MAAEAWTPSTATFSSPTGELHARMPISMAMASSTVATWGSSWARAPRDESTHTLEEQIRHATRSSHAVYVRAGALGARRAIENGAVDCTLNGQPDSCQLQGGDVDGNGVLDLCETLPGVVAGTIVNPANCHHYDLLAPSNWTLSEAAAQALGGTLAIVNDDDVIRHPSSHTTVHRVGGPRSSFGESTRSLTDRGSVPFPASLTAARLRSRA